MAEQDIKKYPNQPENDPSAAEEEEDLGYVELADEVIAIVASLAALDVPGVVSMSTGFREGISNFLGKKSLAKGVRVKVTGRSCRIAVYVTVEYGCVIPEVAMKLQKKVKSAVDEMTEYTAEFVDVHMMKAGWAQFSRHVPVKADACRCPGFQGGCGRDRRTRQGISCYKEWNIWA